MRMFSSAGTVAVLAMVCGSLACTNSSGGSSSSTSSSSSSTGGGGSSSGGRSSSRASSGGGSSSGALVPEEGSCVTDLGDVLECVAGLDCITDDDLDPSYGACKQTCTMQSDCPGRSCALGFLGPTEGVCGSPRGLDATGCTFWETGAQFCFDAALPSGVDDAYLECVNNTCKLVCASEDDPTTIYTCPAGMACGSTFVTVAGYDVRLALCEPSSSSSSGGVSSSRAGSSSAAGSSVGGSSAGASSTAGSSAGASSAGGSSSGGGASS